MQAGSVNADAIQARVITSEHIATGSIQTEHVAAGSVTAEQMGTANDNRRTYNNQSSVNLTGNTFIIRNEDDARNLAIQIAGLTKKQQVGYGGTGATALGG